MVKNVKLFFSSNKLFLALFVLLFISGSVFSQILQPKRVEIELDDYDEYFRVISAEEEGLLLIREKNERETSKDRTWEILKYDTNLTQDWAMSLNIDDDYSLRGYEYRPNYLYLLYKPINYQDDKMVILAIDLENNQFDKFELSTVMPINLTEFTIAGNAALLGGYVNYMPAVIHYDLSTQKVKVLPGIYNNRSELIEIDVDAETNIFNVLVTEKTYDKRNTLAIKTFDQNGVLLQNRTLETKGTNSILFGRSTKFNQNEQFIAGTYANNKSSYSSGIFITKLDALGGQDITYISYADLKNFFTYMKAKREARVRDRINRRKISGKKVRFKYRLLVHDIVEKDDMFLLFGEAFYPKYNNTSLSSMSFGGYSTPNRGYENLYFAGYKYTHAVVVAFDKNGKVLWDNSFEINDVTSYSLDQYVNASIKDDKIILLYLYENVIRSKIINEDEIIEGKTFDDIKMTFGDDVAKDQTYQIGGLSKWYDEYFYAYGIQQIKNIKDKNVKLNRKVFYLNKITYQ